MKKLLTVALSCAMLLSVSVSANAGDRGHLRTGITAGFTSSSANPKNWDASSLGRFHAGFTMQIPIALGFAVQPAVVDQAKGTKLDGSRIEDGTELPADMNAKVSYVEIPVQIQWGPDLVALRPYVFAEPFVGYGLHAKASSSSDGVSIKTTSFGQAGLSRWEYGLGLGAGIDIWRLQASVKYYWNFGSLYNDTGKLNDIGSQIRDAFKDGRNFNGVTVSLAYFF